MTLADLQPFCGTDPTRFHLHSPFPVNGHTYATDGRILIRVPLITGTPDIEGHPKNPGKVIPENLEGYIPAELPPGWQDIPQKTTPCERCAATGKLTYTVSECKDCQGTGTYECQHCHHESDCETCKGEGQVHTPAPGGATCPDCEGQGHDPATTWVSLNRGLCFAALHYLKLAHTLPNLRIRLLDHAAPLRFDFDGGIGVLMPGRFLAHQKDEVELLTATQWHG
jgi:hypothetical protein